MTWRKPASRILFGLGLALVAGALAMLVASWTLPAQGLEDLGRVVGALLLAGSAGVAFGLALVLARGTGAPRWMVATAALGSLVAVFPALGFLSVGTTGGAAFGALFLLVALAGLASVPSLWRRRSAA